MTFFFYDLETSGLSARKDRIMQFAGQRTDNELNPIGEPVNVLVALNDDTLPDPDAIMVTGITPQKTLEEGYTEAQFAHMLITDIFTPDTIVVGYNSVRFDDEFIRHLLWRNFIDPYEWSWKEGRSRWDILDVVRMTRALRPEGIEWPVDAEGKAVNKLEPIAKINHISHENAHDALSDVNALIDVTRLIRNKQPQLFEYLLKLRDKKEVQKLINLDDKQPFVYTSGRFDNQFEKTTVSFPIAPAPNNNVLVYDLRDDPTQFMSLTEDELAAKLFAPWEERSKEGFVRLPVKILQYNRCPAVAPLGVLESGDGWKRIGLDIATVEAHKKILLSHPDFAERLRSVFERTREYAASSDPDAQLYDGFLADRDRLRVEAVRVANDKDLVDLHPDFSDERLPALLLHYKARNFPKSLSEDEVGLWEAWRAERINEALPKYLAALEKISTSTTDNEKQFLVQELQLWAESVIPVAD